MDLININIQNVVTFSFSAEHFTDFGIVYIIFIQF